MNSDPLLTAGVLPITGASISLAPFNSAPRSSSCAMPGPVVLMSMIVLLDDAWNTPSRPKYTSRTACGPVTMLTTTSAPRAASAGVLATGPTPRASALLLVRSQTDTSKPPFFNRRAIAPPIFPVPSTATLVVIRQPPVLALPPSRAGFRGASHQDAAP